MFAAQWWALESIDVATAGRCKKWIEKWPGKAQWVVEKICPVPKYQLVQTPNIKQSNLSLTVSQIHSYIQSNPHTH